MTDQPPIAHEETDKTGADRSIGLFWMDRCWEQMRQFMGEAPTQQESPVCCGPLHRSPGTHDSQK